MVFYFNTSLSLNTPSTDSPSQFPKQFLMSKYEKRLPPLPCISQQHGHQVPHRLKARRLLKQTSKNDKPLSERQYRLQVQNKRLQHALWERDEKIAQLQETLVEYQHCIKKQIENFLQTTQTLCSAFESYRQMPVSAKDYNISPIDEIIQAYTSLNENEGNI